MKLDMHCHTAEGSSDSKVSIIDYIKLLKEYGYDGMLVTDHDSYNGYRYYVNHKSEAPDDFVVLSGIEYDTFEAGHFIVIMPDGEELDVLECRGLKVYDLIDLVHKHGGIVGPAHPCGEPFLSVFSTGRFKNQVEQKRLMSQIDFIETFNCGEDREANDRAIALAKKYNVPMTGGSDAHWEPCVGLAYTLLQEKVTNNNELIAYIKAKKHTKVWGMPYPGTLKARLGKWNKLLVYGFFPYNKYGAFIDGRKRKEAYERDLKR